MRQRVKNQRNPLSTPNRAGRIPGRKDFIMIVVKTDRIYCVYVRTNRRIKWQYAEYGGRYETIEKAIEVAKERMGETPFEYRFEELGGEVVATGLVNWN